MNITDLISGEWKRITGCTLFRGVVEDIIARALEDERCRLIVLKKNAVVFDVYDYRNCLGLVLSGSIAVTKPSGSRYVMTNLWRGSLFGSANLYDDDTDVVSVLTASSACRIVFFPRALVEALMGEANDIALNYIRFLTGRVRFLNDRIQGLVSGSAEAALKQYLMQNAAASGDNNIVRLPGSISSLAGTLNIGRASLYRAFESLERAGIIKKTGKEIEITSPDGLSIIE
ncbi:MAG: Crp/Fnr family transcriptional regulator [Clostridiales bacterium]|nr:Crp/Fnr family transcriptional regulator [Clostridiales bacterium]